MIHPTAKVSEEVNRKCRPRNSVNFQPPTLTLCALYTSSQTDRQEKNAFCPIISLRVGCTNKT